MRQRRLWSPQEDKVLKHLRQQQKIKKWSQIAKMMQQDYNMPNRTGKQCRQRYFNHLDSQIKREEWSDEEERILWQMHSQYGNRWTLMATKLKGRSQNCIKNHFYSKLRKAVRRLNKHIIQQFRAQYKQIKTSLLYKILESAEDKFRPGKSSNIETMDLATSIKNRLFLYQAEQFNVDKGKQNQIARGLIVDIHALQDRLKKQAKYEKNNSGFLDPRHCRRMNHSFDSQDNFSQYSSTSYNSSFMASEDEDSEILSQQQKSPKNPLRKSTILAKHSFQDKHIEEKSEMQEQEHDQPWAQKSLQLNSGKKQKHQNALGNQLFVQSLTLRPSKSQKTLSFQSNIEDKVSDIQPTKNTQFGQFQKCISDIAKQEDSLDDFDINDDDFYHVKSNRDVDDFFDEPFMGQGFQLRVLSPKVPSQQDCKNSNEQERMDDEALW